MNILIVNHYAGSPKMGMEFRHYYLAREWVREGHNVTIIAADYSHLRQTNPNINKDFKTENIDGINYFWVKTGRYLGNGIKRVKTMILFSIKLIIKSKWIERNIKPDVIISSSTYHTDNLSARIIRKLSQKKVTVIHEIKDMWPETLIELGNFSKRNIFVKALYYFEKIAYVKSDKIVTLLSNSKEYIMSRGVEEEKIFYIPNGIVEEDWETPAPLKQDVKKVLKELKNDNNFIVGYFGGHAISNALDTLIDVAIEFKNKLEIKFVLVGEGTEKQRLINRVMKERLSNVLFLNPIEKLQIPSLLEYFDCVYMGGKYSSLYNYGISFNKYYDALMSGTPIIFALSPASDEVNIENCGISIEPNNIEKIVEAIDSFLVMDKIEFKRLGDNGKRLAHEKYLYSTLSKKFESIFTD